MEAGGGGPLAGVFDDQHSAAGWRGRGSGERSGWLSQGLRSAWGQQRKDKKTGKQYSLRSHGLPPSSAGVTIYCMIATPARRRS
jgi:hypothetical protein